LEKDKGERKEEKAKKKIQHTNQYSLPHVCSPKTSKRKKKVKLMIATRSKVKSKEGKEPLYHTLGAVAGERQIRNILRGRLMRVTAKESYL
jgi:hypothetical protein